MVQCKTCGYLAARIIEDRSISEIEESFRDTGKMPTPNNKFTYDPIPLCFAGESQLREDIGHPTMANLAASLEKDRECVSFIKWRLGHTPKEHLQMKMLQEQRDWQEARLKEDREIAERRLKEDSEWRSKESREAEERHKASMLQSQLQHTAALNTSQGQHKSELLVIGIRATWIVAITAIAASVIGACIERGYWWTPPEQSPPTVIIQQMLSPSDQTTTKIPN